jgi:5-methylcytosine-specific restriction enzyme subunit McrC
VRKGLKKSYYRVERNLRGKVKGKILVGKTIKQNQLQNKRLHTYCSYDVFGVNHKENRLLKKALTFVKRYLPNYPQLNQHKELQDTFNYINPAFIEVSEEIELNELKQTKASAFYKEYESAIYLAKLILKRFGYNISNTAKQTIATPPFWIDMSKMFELYVLGLLKDRFRNQVRFQARFRGGELDYLLNSTEYKMVIDAKYKSVYIDSHNSADIRQVSGYARLRKVYAALGKEQGDIIDCLIIYPDLDNGIENLEEVDLRATEIESYYDVYKLGVKLPLVP